MLFPFTIQKKGKQHWSHFSSISLRGYHVAFSAAMPKKAFHVQRVFFSYKDSQLSLTVLLPLGGREAGFGLEGAEEGFI